jgi:glycosyltransferase involved in cell wall biosynthesis
MPFFSIIIPTYNSARLVSNAIDSLLVQTFTDFEVLVIDGCSTDNTVDVILSFDDKRVQVFSEKDDGIYDAMNKGIRLAKGQWLYFLGSDDLVYDETVFSQVHQCITTTNESFYYGNAVIKGNASWAKDGDIYDGEFTNEKILERNICHQSVFYKTSFIQLEIGDYNTKYKICADWDFNLRCWAKTKCRYVNIIISKFSAGGKSTTENRDLEFEKDFVVNLLSTFKLNPFDPLLRHLRPRNRKEVARLQRQKNLLLYYFNKVNYILNK